jgi:hypothetical protein
MRAGIVREHADDVDLGEILERDAFERAQLAAEDEMEKLFLF